MFESVRSDLNETSRAPRPRQVEVADLETNESTLIDVDAPHVSAVPSDFESQSVKTNTQAERIDREEEQDEAFKARSEESRRKGRAGAKGAKLGCSNPVVVGNAVLATAVSAGLGFSAYQHHVRGDLSWKLIGLWSGAVGAVSVVDYVVSK